MKKYFCALTLSSLLLTSGYGADEDGKGLSFGLGLDYGFDWARSSYQGLPLFQGLPDVVTNTFDNKIGLLASLQYVSDIGIVFDTQIRLAYLIPSLGIHGAGNLSDSLGNNINSAGFSTELALLGGYRLGFGSVGLAIKTGIAYAYSMGHYSINNLPANTDVYLLNNQHFLSWKIGLEADFNKVMLGFLVGVPFFYAQQVSTHANIADVNFKSTAPTNMMYDAFSDWGLASFNVYVGYRF